MIHKKISVDGVLRDLNTPCYILHINGLEDRFFFSMIYIDHNGDVSVQNCVAPINLGAGLDSVSIGLVCGLQSIAHRNRGFETHVFIPTDHGDISKHVDFTRYSRLNIYVGNCLGTELIKSYLSVASIECVRNDELKFGVLKDDYKEIDTVQKECTNLFMSGEALIGAFTSLVGRYRNSVNAFCEPNKIEQIACSGGNVYKATIDYAKPQPTLQPVVEESSIVPGDAIGTAPKTNISVIRPQTDAGDSPILYSCPYCDRKFTKTFALTNHVRNTHPDKFEEYSKTR